MVESKRKPVISTNPDEIKRQASQSFSQFLMSRMVRFENMDKDESHFYPEAILLYSKAIELDETNVTFYMNRA